jgi:hypothetical protein
LKVVGASPAGALGMLLGVLAGVACEPQEIYLFERGNLSVDAGRGNAGPGNGGSAGAPSEPEPPEARTAPPCESAECEACQADVTRCPRQSNLFCHPRTGECALGCDPEAANQGTLCPSNQVCHPVDGVCVDCVSSVSCTMAGLGACDTERGTCVECTGPASCPAARPVCDTDAQRCVECLTLADCNDDDARFCFQSRCVECRTRADCTIEPDRPICSDEFECEDED